MATSRFQIGWAAALALLALRLGVGWQFYKEGTDKLTAPEGWSSVGFLRASHGPLEPVFKRLIWDDDGLARLDGKRTMETWAQYRDQVAKQYGFSDQQRRQAESINQRYVAQLNDVLAANGPDIYEYRRGLQRRDKDAADPQVQGVDSLRGYASQRKMELYAKQAPWLSAIDSLWDNYAQELNALATEQQANAGPVRLKLPARSPLDSKWQSWFIPWFDLTVGGLLIVGLFTRLSALAAAGFLASIVATQWPLHPDSLPTYYQVNLLLALLVLAATAAGRFAGLDYIVANLWKRCCAPKQEAQK